MQDDERRPIAVIVDRDGLGDVILRLPLLRAIRAARPGVPVWWLAAYTSTMETQVLPYVGDLVDRVMPDLGFTRTADAFRVLSKLPPFAEVFDLRTRIASVLAARLALRHGPYYANLPGLRRRSPHVGLRALKLAERAFGRVTIDGRLSAGAEAEAVARTLLPPGAAWVGIAFGSNQARKNWPLDRFIALAGRLAAAGLRPVFLVGPNEVPSLPMLRAEAASFAVVDMTAMAIAAPRGKLDAALGLAPSLRMLVANDNGLGHLFGAAGVPVLSLFGPTDPDRWSPITPKGRIVRAQDTGGTAMVEIGVDAVAEAALGLWSEIERP